MIIWRCSVTLGAVFAFLFSSDLGSCTGLCLCAHMNDFILYCVEGGINDGGWMYLISFVCVVDTA